MIDRKTIRIGQTLYGISYNQGTKIEYCKFEGVVVSSSEDLICVWVANAPRHNARSDNLGQMMFSYIGMSIAYEYTELFVRKDERRRAFLKIDV